MEHYSGAGLSFAERASWILGAGSAAWVALIALLRVSTHLI